MAPLVSLDSDSHDEFIPITYTIMFLVPAISVIPNLLFAMHQPADQARVEATVLPRSPGTSAKKSYAPFVTLLRPDLDCSKFDALDTYGT